MNDFINDKVILQSLGHRLWEMEDKIPDQPKHIDTEDDIEVEAKAPTELKVKTEIL